MRIKAALIFLPIGEQVQVQWGKWIPGGNVRNPCTRPRLPNSGEQGWPGEVQAMEKRPAKTILLIEDDPEEARLVDEMLNDSISCVFELTHVESVGDAERYLAVRSVDIVLIDLGLADPPGLEAVGRVRAAAPRVSIV